MEGELGEDAADRFDIDAPLLALVSPTAEDEGMAAEDSPEKPETLTESMNWSKDRAFDKSVKSFGTFYLNIWASDAVYEIVCTNVSKAKASWV
jgi:hypothetical protein